MRGNGKLPRRAFRGKSSFRANGIAPQKERVRFDGIAAEGGSASVGRSRRRSAPRVLWCLLAVIITAIASTVLAIAFGIYLGEKAEQSRQQSEGELSAFEKVAIPTDVCYIAGVFEEDVSALADGFNGVSLVTRNESGRLMCHFDSAAVFSQGGQNGEIDPLHKTEAYHNVSARVSCVFYVTSQGIENETQRRAAEFAEVAMIEELAEAGVDEILIMGLNFSSKDDISESVIKLISEMKAVCGKTALGIALPKVISHSLDSIGEELRVILNKFGAADFFAADHTFGYDITSNSKGLELVREYRLRILLADSKSNAQRVSALNNAEIFNIQFVAVDTY